MLPARSRSLNATSAPPWWCRTGKPPSGRARRGGLLCCVNLSAAAAVDPPPTTADPPGFLTSTWTSSPARARGLRSRSRPVQITQPVRPNRISTRRTPDALMQRPRAVGGDAHRPRALTRTARSGPALQRTRAGWRGSPGGHGPGLPSRARACHFDRHWREHVSRAVQRDGAPPGWLPVGTTLTRARALIAGSHVNGVGSRADLDSPARLPPSWAAEQPCWNTGPAAVGNCPAAYRLPA